MFWFKKKLKEHIKEVVNNEPTNMMFIRLENMCNKLKLIVKEGSYQTPNFSVYLGCNFIYKITFETSLGQKEFDLQYYTDHSIPKYNLEMYEPVKVWFIPRSFYNDPRTLIFEVHALEDTLYIKPQMKEDELTSFRIDMAIYELEQEINKHYEIYKENEIFHKEEISKLMKGN